jgi:hypothetical protein
MMFGVQRLQSFLGDVGVNLCGGDVGMPEQHLHHAQIGAVVEQVGGEGVAQRVRRQRCFGCRRWRRGV